MSYSSEVLADSPRAYYRLGDAAGSATVVDASGNGNTGTIAPTVTLGQPSLISDADTAATFGGGYIDVGGGLPGSGPVTVECLIRPTTQDANFRPIFAAHGSGSVSLDSALVNGQIQARVFAGSFQAVTSTTILSLNTTYHIALVWDDSAGTSTTIRIYINGVLDNSGVVGVRSNTNPGLCIGGLVAGYAGTAYRYLGDLDEAAVYLTALSGTRISAHYAAASGPTPATGTLAATLPPLSANLSGGITFSGTITATLPALGANLSGTSAPAGISGSLSATLPPLSANLAGSYAAVSFSGTLSATLPALSADIAGQTFSGTGTEGYVSAVLPALTASLAGRIDARNGFGLVLASTATISAEAPFAPDTATVPLHIIATTVPVPTLVAGRPQ